MSYSEKDEREHHDSHEDLKILAARPAWLGHHGVTCLTTAQKEAVNTGAASSYKTAVKEHGFNGWTPIQIVVPLEAGLLSGEIEIIEKGTGTPAEIRDRRERRA
jgi:hypothetical protein